MQETKQIFSGLTWVLMRRVSSNTSQCWPCPSSIPTLQAECWEYFNLSTRFTINPSLPMMKTFSRPSQSSVVWASPMWGCMRLLVRQRQSNRQETKLLHFLCLITLWPGYPWGPFISCYSSTWWSHQTIKVGIKLFLWRHFFLSLSCRQKVPSAATLQLHSFQFDDFSLEDTDMLKVILT